MSDTLKRVVVLDNKRGIIIGMPGSGKTELAKHIISSTDKYIVYDTLGADRQHHDFDGYRKYSPKDRHSKDELSRFILDVVIPNRNHVRLFVVDESNNFIQPKPAALPAGIADLNDLSRHWGIAWLLIARRAVQFHTDVVALAHYLFVFTLSGKADVKYFNDLMAGLGDAISKLPKHHFIVVDMENHRFWLHAPVPWPVALPPHFDKELTASGSPR